MNTRRSFLKTIGKGSAVSALVLSPVGTLASHITGKLEDDKIIRIGIIGAENSHTVEFGRLFNIRKEFPGVEVNYVWGETEELARNAMEKGNIPNMVKDQKEMLGKIDALIVDHRHAKYHLEAATPFIKEGIPTFIDKPFCYRVEEGAKFLEMASNYGTPVTSYSSIAHCEATFYIKKQIEEMGKINNLVSFGPVDLDSEYGGIFFYGIHLVEPLMYIIGETVEKVKVTRNGSQGSASLVFAGGLFATLVFRSLSYGWNTYVETEKSIIELKSPFEESKPAKYNADMVEMFRTGKEPRSHQSILNSISVLEALEKSSITELWEKVNNSIAVK